MENGVRVSIIVAMDLNGTIGNSATKSGLPWPRLPRDTAEFVKITTPKPVILGRKTYEFIPTKFRPLQGRPTIVVSRTANYAEEELRLQKQEHATTVTSCDTALDIAIAFAQRDRLEEIVIAGGETVYDYFLKKNLVDRIYLTEVMGEFEGDAKFPINLDEDSWTAVELKIPFPADNINPYSMIFSTLDRKSR